MFEWIETWKEPSVQRKWKRLSRIPLPVLDAVIRAGGFLMHARFSEWSKTVQQNMECLLGERDPSIFAGQSRRYMQNLLRTLCELTVLSDSLERRGERLFRVEGEAWLEAALKHERGVILHTPHIGNFFYYYWYVSRKYPALTVATAQPDIRFLYETFQRLGCNGMDYDTTPPLK